MPMMTATASPAINTTESLNRSCEWNCSSGSKSLLAMHRKEPAQNASAQPSTGALPPPNGSRRNKTAPRPADWPARTGRSADAATSANCRRPPSTWKPPSRQTACAKSRPAPRRVQPAGRCPAPLRPRRRPARVRPAANAASAPARCRPRKVACGFVGERVRMVGP